MNTENDIKYFTQVIHRIFDDFHGKFKYDNDVVFMCLYTIEDSEKAISFYLESDFPEDDGGKYLYLFGLYQAMYVQQDAIAILAKCFKCSSKLSSNRKNKARKIRNSIFGHPMNSGRGGSIRYYGIFRNEISKNRFNYAEIKPEKGQQWGGWGTGSTDVGEDVKANKEKNLSNIKIIFKKLKTLVSKHCRRYAKVKLADRLKERDYSYYCMSLLDDGRRGPYNQGKIEELIAVIEEVKEELLRRGGEELLSTFDLELLLFSLERIRLYQGGGKIERFTKDDAKIHAYYIRSKYKELIAKMEELDLEYEQMSDPENIK